MQDLRNLRTDRMSMIERTEFTDRMSMIERIIRELFIFNLLMQQT